jgi:hypothetical protein
MRKLMIGGHGKEGVVLANRPPESFERLRLGSFDVQLD